MRRGLDVGLIVAALVAAGCGSRPSREPIFVGHLAPLSGPERVVGEHARQGIRQALADWHAAHPDGGRPVEVVHADTQGNAELAQAETVRLLTVNKVAALLAGPGAGPAERILRADQPYAAPVVIPGELPASASTSLARSLGADPAARGATLAKYAARDLKATKAVVLTDSNDVVAGAVGTAFRKEWPAGGSGSVDEWTFSSDKDAADLVSRTGRARPEVVLLACRPEQFRTLRDNFAAAGYKGPLVYGGEDVGSMAGLTDAGPEIYLATVYCPEKLTDRGKEFARRYEAEFHEPPDLHAAAAYDAACLLFDILAEAASPTTAVLREQLGRTESFETVTGPVAWKDHETRRTLFLLHGQRGQRHLVQTIEPHHD